MLRLSPGRASRGAATCAATRRRCWGRAAAPASRAAAARTGRTPFCCLRAAGATPPRLRWSCIVFYESACCEAAPASCCCARQPLCFKLEVRVRGCARCTAAGTEGWRCAAPSNGLACGSGRGDNSCKRLGGHAIERRKSERGAGRRAGASKRPAVGAFRQCRQPELDWVTNPQGTRLGCMEVCRDGRTGVPGCEPKGGGAAALVQVSVHRLHPPYALVLKVPPPFLRTPKNAVPGERDHTDYFQGHVHVTTAWQWQDIKGIGLAKGRVR